jgi:hypothetical protein
MRLTIWLSSAAFSLRSSVSGVLKGWGIGRFALVRLASSVGSAESRTLQAIMDLERTGLKKSRPRLLFEGRMDPDSWDVQCGSSSEHARSVCGGPLNLDYPDRIPSEKLRVVGLKRVLQK